MYCSQNYRSALLSGIIVVLLVCGFAIMPASASPSTELHVVRYAPDGKTVTNETTVDYRWMETHLPVMGDGTTHYYHQGPVFVDDPDPVREEQLRLNAAEDTNVQEKDMGAVKGTTLKDLCDLVGGMAPGDIVKVKAVDGFSKTFAYENVYTPTARQGAMVITWYHADEGYVPQYRTGMRLVFFADNSTNPWGIHAFGSTDWHETAAPEYIYYYQQGSEKYPTTTGLSVQTVSDILVYSRSPVQGESTRLATTAPVVSPTKSGISLFTVVGSLAACGVIGYILQKRN